MKSVTQTPRWVIVNAIHGLGGTEVMLDEVSFVRMSPVYIYPESSPREPEWRRRQNSQSKFRSRGRGR